MEASVKAYRLWEKQGAIDDEQAPVRHDSKVDNDTPSAAPGCASTGADNSTTDASLNALSNAHAVAQNSSTSHALDTANIPSALLAQNHHKQPPSTSSALETTTPFPSLQFSSTLYETPPQTIPRHAFTSPDALAPMSSSLRSNLSASSMNSSVSPASSALPSPYLAAMTDLTPLPSPIMNEDPSAAWHRPRVGTGPSTRHGSIGDATRSGRAASVSSLATSGSPSRKKKVYGSLLPAAVEAAAAGTVATQQEDGQTPQKHTRNRSISDFVPETLHNVRQRHVTFGPGDAAGPDYHMHREDYLAAQRGLTALSTDFSSTIPTPPPSNTSIAESEDAEDDQVPLLEDGEPSEYLHIHCGINNRQRRFRQLRQLGQGTFSKVMLATNERVPARPPPDIEQHLDPHRLVAVKIVEHGPAGGVNQERVETSLKREVEMIRSISHPSIIHLKACEHQPSRTLLVLTYCSGGDLFDLASARRDALNSFWLQRMFAELVSAVRYLHTNWIVHRDIKLENVLVNMPIEKLAEIKTPFQYPFPVLTLSDLGLSRRIPEPPESPLLTTRCGSEDYAAPEILLGQPYDGRLTDAWSLGVLLYALMEGRMPFDAPPGKPDRSRNTHRIARCDWIWCRFGDQDGEWDPKRGAGFENARICVEALLRKVRMGRKPLEEIEKIPWVQEGIDVPGGLQTREEDLEDF